MRVTATNGSALAVLMAVSLQIACVDFEPTEPAEPPVRTEPGPATLNAQIHLSTGSQEIVRFDGLFLPGSDANGVVRSVTSDTIVILERRIVAHTVGPGGTLLFSDEWSLSPDEGREAAQLFAPQIAGRDRPLPALEFGLCRGEEPYDMSIARDDTVQFEMSCHYPAEPEHGEWSLNLSLAESGRSILIQRGRPTPPPIMPIPALVLNHGDRSELIATFTVAEAWRAPELDADYEMFLGVISESSWRVRWK